VFRIGDTINAVIPVDLLEEYGLHWVKTERDARYPRARRLTAEEQGSMTPFFSPAALAVARIQHIPTIPNPAFYDALPQMGLAIPLDFSRMWGLTLIDCILIAESKVGVGQLPRQLLFHELVHVAQYQLLGVDDFIHRYVRGWSANGEDYNRIPVEVQAYTLDQQYAAEPSRPFPVKEVVAATLHTL
jgi:hypothetical protein